MTLVYCPLGHITVNNLISGNAVDFLLDTNLVPIVQFMYDLI